MTEPTSRPDPVSVLRRFNRTHTRRVGALDESFLGSGRPLGPSRVLYEIGPDGASVLEIRHRLGLDAGYTSRLLRRLERDDLIVLATDPADARRRVAHLTPAGRRAWRELDRASDELAVSLLAPLTDRCRHELAEALATADRLLRAATVDFEVVDPRSDLATTAMQRYFDELHARFEGGFDPGDTLVADAPGFDPPHGAFVVAVADSAGVACGGLQRVDATTSEIKRMWVDPDWRGVGLGRRVLARLEELAADRGATRVVLDTNAVLTEAIAMYDRAGYTAVDRYNDNPYAQRWFAKELTS